MIAQIVATAIGIWLMLAPAAFGYGGVAADMDRTFGPIAATFATVAWWEATRLSRWVNLPIGIWLAVAPWVLGYDAVPAIANSMICGIALANLALVGGRIQGRYGGGWASLLPSRRVPHPGEILTGDVDDLA